MIKENRETQKKENVVEFVPQRVESKAARMARIARITAIIDDPCRATWVRWPKSA
jgi:hypothetical protein